MAGRSNVKLARQVWSRMFDFLMRTAPERNRSLGRRGLTPNDARALSSLDRVTGRSMRELAEQWECDASNATWIVDRLERFGLAERRPVPGDRRVSRSCSRRRGSGSGRSCWRSSTPPRPTCSD